MSLARHEAGGTWRPLPREIGQLTQLTHLDLQSSQLTSEIPPELGRLHNLTDLDLYENHLAGEIPPELGQLRNLETLRLSINRLTGPIPPELGQLQKGYLAYNLKLTGTTPAANDQAVLILGGALPPELGQLPNLTSSGAARQQSADIGQLPACRSWANSAVWTSEVEEHQPADRPDPP